MVDRCASSVMGATVTPDLMGLGLIMQAIQQPSRPVSEAKLAWSNSNSSRLPPKLITGRTPKLCLLVESSV